MTDKQKKWLEENADLIAEGNLERVYSSLEYFEKINQSVPEFLELAITVGYTLGDDFQIFVLTRADNYRPDRVTATFQFKNFDTWVELKAEFSFIGSNKSLKKAAKWAIIRRMKELSPNSKSFNEFFRKLVDSLPVEIMES